MKKNRWYDKHEGLANHLEALKVMPKRQLIELLKDLIAFARLLHPTLFEDHLFEYPLDPKRRRWYDDDPYLWLVVNGLRFTDDEVIRKVVAFFDKQIGVQPEAPKKNKRKKPAVKKTASNKSSVKKSVPKKSAVAPANAKKSSSKKSAAAPVKAKKTAPKKSAAAPVKAKKTAPKKSAAATALKKKTVPEKAVVKQKPAAKAKATKAASSKAPKKLVLRRKK